MQRVDFTEDNERDAAVIIDNSIRRRAVGRFSTMHISVRAVSRRKN